MLCGFCSCTCVVKKRNFVGVQRVVENANSVDLTIMWR